MTLLLAPLIAYDFGLKDLSILRENRTLAPAPACGAGPIASLPAKTEAYYTDRFGFRSSLIHIYSIVLRRWLKASNDDVVLGKDRWIFYAREEILQDFLGMRPFSQDELQRWRDYLESRRETLARQNARYLFVIGPDKNTIYPEKLPDYIREHRGRSRSQQLLEYLRTTGSPVDVLDLHEGLLAAKATGTLYFLQDTHWNGRGFFVAYQAICLALRRWFPEITPESLGQSYTIRLQAVSFGEWSLLGLPEENLTYVSPLLVPLGTQRARNGAPVDMPSGTQPIRESWLKPRLWLGPGKRSLLVFHDSYMRCCTRNSNDGARPDAYEAGYQPLAEHFARMLLVGRQSEHDEQLFINQFHPDIVIEEWAERVLAAVPRPRPASLGRAGWTTVQPK